MQVSANNSKDSTSNIQINYRLFHLFLGTSAQKINSGDEIPHLPYSWGINHRIYLEKDLKYSETSNAGLIFTIFVT